MEQTTALITTRHPHITSAAAERLGHAITMMAAQKEGSTEAYEIWVDTANSYKTIVTKWLPHTTADTLPADAITANGFKRILSAYGGDIATAAAALHTAAKTFRIEQVAHTYN